MCSFDGGPELSLGVRSVDELTARLHLAGFLVRRLDGTPGLEDGRYFCVAVRTREDNEKLIAALREIVAGC